MPHLTADARQRLDLQRQQPLPARIFQSSNIRADDFQSFLSADSSSGVPVDTRQFRVQSAELDRHHP